jgi:hypothetical protein
MRLLGLADVLLGELCSHEAPEIVRFDMLDPSLGGVFLDQLPGGRLAERLGCRSVAAAGPGREDVGARDWSGLHPGYDERMGFPGERCKARLGVILALDGDHPPVTLWYELARHE